MEQEQKDVAQKDRVAEEDIEIINETTSDSEEELEAEKSAEEEITAEAYAALQEEKDEIYNRLLRVQAEYDNFKRRTQKERTSDLKYKSQDLATELLPALDNFERALQVEETEENKGMIEGITMVYNQLLEALKSQGVELIETENQPFDPNLHHAVMQVEDETLESNVVVEELQKGYMLKDRVIRPAMVKVNK